tara:strand:+ start:1594 stop:1884 length:291 start_codon:yes stop_codon:yes gene_type:complete
MKTLKQFLEYAGSSGGGNGGPMNDVGYQFKMKAKKDVKVKDAKIKIMPKLPDTPDKALGVKEEVNKCGKGQYFCNERKKCMPIPKGAKVDKNGILH